MTPEPDQRPVGESLYRLLILNDSETPMEFVVDVMERFVGKDHEAALRSMLYIHHHGIGDCGGSIPMKLPRTR
jgi:ATP-dependent Clp protease adaptor protein ClpS